ncbi:hypothetical protein Efla_004388 [Eimeria flavescens]
MTNCRNPAGAGGEKGRCSSSSSRSGSSPVACSPALQQQTQQDKAAPKEWPVAGDDNLRPLRQQRPTPHGQQQRCGCNKLLLLLLPPAGWRGSATRSGSGGAAGGDSAAAA